MTRASRYLTCAGFEIHVSDWGDPAAEPIVMWHGLARSGRDFDDLARHLSDRYRIVCPDTIGRGLSQWSSAPERDYCFDVYGRIAIELIDQLGMPTVRWVGTSLGGLIGAMLAGGALKDRISHLVLNDVGPDIPASAIERIVSYVGNPPRFDGVNDYIGWIRTVYAPFGEQDDATWARLAETTCRRTDDGGITVHYDPRIVAQFTEHGGDLDIWATYDAIACPTLLMRGESSDVLTRETAHASNPSVSWLLSCGTGLAAQIDLERHLA